MKKAVKRLHELGRYFVTAIPIRQGIVAFCVSLARRQQLLEFQAHHKRAAVKDCLRPKTLEKLPHKLPDSRNTKSVGD